MKFSAIGDDEQPHDPKAELKGMLDRSLAHEEAKVKDLSRSLTGKERYAKSPAMEQARTRAVLLAKDPQFQMWTGAGRSEEAAAAFIKRACRIESRRDIATDSRAFDWFLRLEAQYAEATGRMAENRG